MAPGRNGETYLIRLLKLANPEANHRSNLTPDEILVHYFSVPRTPAPVVTTCWQVSQCQYSLVEKYLHQEIHQALRR